MEDRSLSTIWKMYYGGVLAAKLFEGVTWHSAQHCRQLVAVLEWMGITADRPLMAADLAWLPLLEMLWERVLEREKLYQ